MSELDEQAFDSLSREPWPFAAMSVGDVVKFALSERPNARAYAYRYAQYAGWKVSTRLDRANGLLYVKRTA